MQTTHSKLFVHVLCCICLLLSIPAQSQTRPIYTEDYNLPQQQHIAWRMIHDDWMKQIYWTSLKTHNLNMSCAGCTSIYIDVGLQIDAQGKVTQSEMFGGKTCNEALLKKLFSEWIKYFLEVQFPENLRQLNIKTKLGTGLSC